MCATRAAGQFGDFPDAILLEKRGGIVRFPIRGSHPQKGPIQRVPRPLTTSPIPEARSISRTGGGESENVQLLRTSL